MSGKYTMDYSVRLAAVLLVISLVILSIVPLVPPAPPEDPAQQAFSAHRAFTHIENIAQVPRPIGSLEDKIAQDKIIVELQRLGLEVEVQNVSAPEYYRGTGERIELGNVLARIPGTNSAYAVALVGHIDTVPSTPGANDDGSAIAILLESARAILAATPLKHDVMLVFIDGEEPSPRFGSTAFVEEHPWAKDIRFVINLEAIGSGGPSLLTELSGPRSWMIEQYARAVPFPAAYSYLTTIADLIGGSNTDFATFKKEGFAGFEMVYARDSTIYHTMEDNSQRVSRASLHQHGSNTLALARHFANLETIPGADNARDIFFTIPFLGVARYSESLSIPLSVLTFALLLAAAWRTRTWLRILKSAGLTLLTLIISNYMVFRIWIALIEKRSMMGVAESYAYLLGLALLVFGVALFTSYYSKRKFNSTPEACGVIFIWWLLGIAIIFPAVGVSYLFSIPAFLGALIVFWKTLDVGLAWQPLGSALAVGGTFILLAPAIDTFYHFAQPRPGNPDSEIPFMILFSALLLVLFFDFTRSIWARHSSTGPKSNSA